MKKPSNVIHAFNSGRQYSSDGQRIAWTVLTTGNIAMLDIDRGIDYVLVISEPTDDNVLSAYDGRIEAPWNFDEATEARKLLKALTQAAVALSSR